MKSPAVRSGKRSAYPAYKPSGVEWLGEIPEHWDPVRLRYRAKINPIKSEINGWPDTLDVSFVPMESVHEYGGLSLVQSRALAEVSTGYTYFRDGDVLAAKITPCFENGKGAIAHDLMNGIGFGTTELHVLRPHPSMDRHFLFYVTISHAFRLLGAAEMYGAGGQKRVPEIFIRDFRHSIPPLEEQRAIASFLDRETSRIDALIEKKQRQIALLQEKRSALISHAVTKGLDSNVKMKDSGIEWLGEIPAHWCILAFKRLGKLQAGAGFPDDEQGHTDEEVPFYKVSDTNLPGNEIWMKTHNNSVSRDTARRLRAFIFPKNTIVFAKVGAALLLNKRRILTQPSCIDNNMMGFMPLTCDLNWAFYWLCGLDLGELANPGAVPSINEGQLREIPIPVPPDNEQRAIAAFLDRDTARIDALTEKVEKSIELLQEYRTALISAAVTGKIDVRNLSEPPST